MKQPINPVIAIILVILAVGVAALVLYRATEAPLGGIPLHNSARPSPSQSANHSPGGFSNQRISKHESTTTASSTFRSTGSSSQEKAVHP